MLRYREGGRSVLIFTEMLGRNHVYIGVAVYTD